MTEFNLKNKIVYAVTDNERLEKAQIKVVERDNLLSSSSINTKDSLEENDEEKKAGEVNNRYNANSEQQLN
ncbi:17523_t:CDS:2, partial [Cetraspora pellucida]